MKVLVSAYACEPGKGSEPEVGWQWVHQIARFHEVWVITRANNRNAIETALSENPNDKLHFVYYDLPAWARFWKKGNQGVHLYHQLWQCKILPIARKLNQIHKFDICHHITFGVVWHPSLFYKLPLPLVWGPFGGGEEAYPACVKDFSFRGKFVELIRSLMSVYFFEYDPIVQRNFSKASLLLTRTEMTSKKIPQRYMFKTQVFLETGFIKGTDQSNNIARTRGALFTMSRLIPLKNIETVILAMRRVIDKLPHAKLHIYGNGPLLEKYKELVRKLALDENVLFYGNVEHTKLATMIKNMDVLIHPSVREGGSHAIMEALANGIPVICLDNAGPGYMVDANSGIKIKGENKNDIVRKIADFAIELLTNDEVYNKLSRGAINRVENVFLWDKIGDRLNDLYQEVYNEAKTAKK